MADYTILIVDYDPRSLERLRRPLEAAGYRVEIAKDGPDGIEQFDLLRPDLTLIEAMLPKIHGFDVCKEIKRTPHGQKTPVVIITSVYRGRRYRSQAMHQYGSDGYLGKPIADEDLLAAVRLMLRRGPRETSGVAAGKPKPKPADTTHS